ncbi:hypothetical protein CEN44_08600 [Fischerella muscicola CCMEE 5323]|uniref:Uncharacterized protein n=1 Tax=Fischerella muscicola CCMEE 5323 TaxID=2019572 RepID=A0A2N6K509_FISMU|nr:hypothetical protein CEN44_08600 [Fischerella muscicola CCMEE 5323]
MEKTSQIRQILFPSATPRASSRGTLTLQKPLPAEAASHLRVYASTAVAHGGLTGPLWGWGREPPLGRAASPTQWLLCPLPPALFVQSSLFVC